MFGISPATPLMHFSPARLLMHLCIAAIVILSSNHTRADTTPEAPIDREALVRRHNPRLQTLDLRSPLSVGNGGFTFTVDITGLQTFGADYAASGIPLETQSRWAWVSDDNPANYKLEDTFRQYRQADGRMQGYPTNTSASAAAWLRRNPRTHPLAEIALVWRKPDGTAFAPSDVQAPLQELDLWSGIITSRYQLGGESVVVRTTCAPDQDTLGVTIESPLVARGELAVRVRFPRGHDPAVKNTPLLDWDAPESHQTRLMSRTALRRTVGGLDYYVHSSQPFLPSAEPHTLLLTGTEPRLEFTLHFGLGENFTPVDAGTALASSTAHWADFWRHSAVLDLSGSTDPRAPMLEQRVVLSQYLTAIQMAGAVPPQESGLTCNTWYGKHHTEMVWWNTAHFALWGQDRLLEKNLAWYCSHLPAARALARSRSLQGARWAKMVGHDGRESPGGNPLIAWNQPHPIYLAELLYRADPTPATLARYRDLVLESAACLASMLSWDEQRGLFVLGPPIWIYQELYDPATSQNPVFELAYWRWALVTAQQWRARLGLPPEPRWQHILAHLPPLPQRHGKYVSLESQPDTWDDATMRHDHPEMLMVLGLLPDSPMVDRTTMQRTLAAVVSQWDFEKKIWATDYAAIAMTATRLHQPAVALDWLLRDGPNNRYLPNGHCPQRSDVALGLTGAPTRGRPEIAVYLPANSSLLAAVALMVAGWDGCTQPHPGFPPDGTWRVRAEGWRSLP